MLGKTLNKIFSSRIFFILFSLLVAIVLWMYVEISVNQEITGYEVPNVPVRFRNVELLNGRGLLISAHNPQTVTLTYDLPRGNSTRITNQNLYVEVNLENVARTGSHNLTYDVIYPSGFNRNSFSRESKSVERISLLVDRLTTIPIDVRVDYRGGTAADDLIADPVEYDPATIMVSGPEDVVSRIGFARVPIFMENLSTTYVDDLHFVLLDENGYEMEESLLEAVSLSHDTIHITVPIRQIKEVPLVVELVHGAGSTDRNTVWNIEPRAITVMGDPEALRDFNQILLGPIDTTRFTFSDVISRTIPVPNYLTNQSGETEALVRVEVLGLEYDDYSISTMYFINKPDDVRVEWVTRSLDVRIRGRREDLDLISEMNISAVADLRDRQPGSQRVPASILITGNASDIGTVAPAGGIEYRLTLRLILEDT